MGYLCLSARNRAKTGESYNSGQLRFIGVLFIAFFTFVSCCAVAPPQADAGQAVMGWSASSSTGVIGYKIYFGTASGNYSQNMDVGNVTSYTVTSLIDGQTYYFAAKAYDSAGNLSAFSNEVSKTISSTIPSTYTITATASNNGSITANNNSSVTTSSSGTSTVTNVTVSSGATQSFSITPNSGYSVASVTVDGVSVGAVTTYTFSNITANHTIAATFQANAVNTYTITASAGTNGNISPSGSISINSGASQAYTITPNANYYIVSVSVDGAVVVSNVMTYSYTFNNVNANHTISATFAYCTKLITVSAGTGGAISPTSVYVNVGSSQTFTITPSSGYNISNVTVDGTSVGAVSSYTFSNITTTHTISATFASASAQLTYTITASAGSGGSISSSGTTTVASGSSKTYSIKPAKRYKIADVQVDGASIGAVSSYTFSNVAANHTISATFTR